jgi:ATP-dependent Clp protease protease subunit
MRPFALHLKSWLQTNASSRRFHAESSGSVTEISVFDVIGDFWWLEGVSAKSVKRVLDGSTASTVRVLINSPGGITSDGIAIHNLLKSHPAKVEVEILGEASSSASIIAMAGDTIKIHQGATIMVHRPWTWLEGTSEDFRSAASALDSITAGMLEIYRARTGQTLDEVTRLVTAETYMSADEAQTLGFADEIIAAKAKPLNPPTPQAVAQRPFVALSGLSKRPLFT